MGASGSAIAEFVCWYWLIFALDSYHQDIDRGPLSCPYESQT